MVFLLCFAISRPCPVVASSDGGEERDLSGLQIEDLMGLKVATVYGASKFEQKVTEAPSAISIVTSDDIKRFGYRTLADILRSQRSFYITDDRNYYYVGVRGLCRPGDYNTRVLLLVDGHRTNDNIYNQVMLGNEFAVDVDLIDRIEIIRGPGSSLYGNNAFFATINVITKRGRDVGGMEVSASAGSWDTYSGRVTFGQRFGNGFETLISATGYDSRGQNFHFTNREFDTPENNNGWADHGDKEKAANFFGRASFKNLSLQSAYVSREKWIPTASWDTVFNNGQDKTIDRRGYLDLAYNNTFGKTLDVLARLYYDFYEYEGYYLFDNPPPTLNRDHSEGRWWGATLMLTRRLGANQTVTAGAEYENNTKQLQENYDRSPAYTYLHDDRSSETLGLYLQDEIALRENLALSAGLRYDRYTAFGSSTNPRLALVYTPVPMTIVKALYGQAYRTPNAYELCYNDGNVTQKGNPSLEPETITTYELVLEKYFEGSLRFTASAYYYKVRDIITQVIDADDDLSVFRNTGDVTGKGFELEVEKTWAKDINLRFTQVFQYVEEDAAGERAANSPASLSTLNLSLPLIGPLCGGFEAQYVSRRDKPQGGSVPSYWLANLTLVAKDVVRNLDLSGSIYNLFDQTVKYPTDPGAFRQNELIGNGISFRVKAYYRF